MMAEGGLESTPTGNTSRPAFDSHLLECPICLEQLQQPKSLPCLHSFCQECLGSYIIKDAPGKTSPLSFECPVCRRETRPVKPTDDRGHWARQFPSNELLFELIQSNKACKVCLTKDRVDTPATIWCKTCKILLCSSCKVNFHDVLHARCEAVEISRNEVTSSEVTSSIRCKCEQHDEDIDYYCDDHQTPGCHKCIIIDHRKCEVVTPVDKYCYDLKTSSKLDDLWTSLQQEVRSIERLVKEFTSYVQSTTHDKDDVLSSVKELRDTVIKQLDDLYKRITGEVMTFFKEEKVKLEESVETCEHLKKSIQHTLDASKAAALCENHVETILLYQRGQTEIESCKTMVGEMRKSFTPVILKHELDRDVSAFGKGCTALGRFVVKKQGAMNPANTFTTQLSGGMVKEIRKINIERPSDDFNCGAFGVVYLPDGHIVVGDWNNNKVKLYTDCGVFLDELVMPGKPSDMCLVNTNIVGVAQCDPTAVCVVGIEFSKLSLVSEVHVKVVDACYGIVHVDRNFIVGTSSGVYIIKKNGRTVSSLLQTPKRCYHIGCAPGQQDMFASVCANTEGHMAVYRLAGTVHTTVLKVGVVAMAMGVDVDEKGNVYVCGKESHNVIQMSRDGTNVREILTSADGVQYPRAMSVCGDKFVITNQSACQANFIHVYQLT